MSRRQGRCRLPAVALAASLAAWLGSRAASGEVAGFSAPPAALRARRGGSTFVSSGPQRPQAVVAQQASSAEVTQVEDLVVNAKGLLRQVYPKGGQAAWKNILAGLTVSLAMVPEAVAFAFVAGVSPLVGLWSAVVMGFFASWFGGRAGIMSGAAGSCSVVMVALVSQYGPEYLTGAVLLCGLCQISAGLLDLGKFIKLVPHPVMLGFVNGLAILVARAQLVHFKDRATGMWLLGAKGSTMWGLTGLSMLLVWHLPKLTTALPSSLMSIGIVAVLVKLLGLPAMTLADIAGPETFRGGLSVLPQIGLPRLPLLSAPLKTLAIITPYAVTMAAVGLIESLLTLQIVDGLLDDGRRGSTRKECIGQGLGNFFNGFMGGMGGCALIGQTVINVQSGATSRLSGISMSIFLALGVFAAAPLIGQVPIAGLVGLMFVVCIQTFSWSSLRILNKIPRSDAFVIFLVSIVTVYKDLAMAVVAGTIASALNFAWKQSYVTASQGETAEGWKLYKLRGQLYFASTQGFDDLFDPQQDPGDVVIDFSESRVCDHSALEAINTLAGKYGEAGKTVHLRGLSSDCAGLLERLNGELPPYELVEADPRSDPVYEVAEDSTLYENVAVAKLDREEPEERSQGPEDEEEEGKGKEPSAA